jgi:hypothetical protein
MLTGSLFLRSPGEIASIGSGISDPHEATLSVRYARTAWLFTSRS